MKKLLISAITLVAMMSQASFAQTPTPDQLAQRNIERRAVEAAIWGMPAVNYDLMLQEMLTKTAGKVNQMIYWGRPLDWRNQTLTPNPDTLYFMAFFNTRDVGPIVIEIPPAGADGSLNANIVNIWQQPLEDAGLLGVDKGAGVKLLMLPPGYSDKIPDGYAALQPDTFGSYALFRSNLKSHGEADVAKSVAYGKRVKVLSALPGIHSAGRPYSPTSRTSLFDSTIRYDESFFEGLNRIVQSEPWLDRDRVMIDQLKSLGIEKGKPFAPSAATKQALDDWHPRSADVACGKIRRRPAAVFRGHALDLPGSSRTRPGGSGRLCRAERLSGRCARPRLQLCLYRHQAAGRGPVLSDLDQGQGRRELRRREDLPPDAFRRMRRSSNTGR